LVTCCVETAFCDKVLEGNLKEGKEVKEDEEEYVGSYRMTLRKGGDTHISRRKL
jgi:hypothetical protein